MGETLGDVREFYDGLIFLNPALLHKSVHLPLWRHGQGSHPGPSCHLRRPGLVPILTAAGPNLRLVCFRLGDVGFCAATESSSDGKLQCVPMDQWQPVPRAIEPGQQYAGEQYLGLLGCFRPFHDVEPLPRVFLHVGNACEEMEAFLFLLSCVPCRRSFKKLLLAIGTEGEEGGSSTRRL